MSPLPIHFQSTSNHFQSTSNPCALSSNINRASGGRRLALLTDGSDGGPVPARAQGFICWIRLFVCLFALGFSVVCLLLASPVLFALGFSVCLLLASPLLLSIVCLLLAARSLFALGFSIIFLLLPSPLLFLLLFALGFSAAVVRTCKPMSGL